VSKSVFDVLLLFRAWCVPGVSGIGWLQSNAGVRRHPFDGVVCRFMARVVLPVATEVGPDSAAPYSTIDHVNYYLLQEPRSWPTAAGQTRPLRGATGNAKTHYVEIGRASCRERVYVQV
jgi:hypothetical protein